MSWLLGVADAVFPGTGLFIALQTALFFGALLSLLRLMAGPSWVAVPVTAICALLPQILLYQGIVWKDVLFADTAIAGFVCLELAAGERRAVRFRFALLGSGCLFFAFATLARQNGAILLPVGAAALASNALTAGKTRQRRNALVHASLFLVVTILFAIAANSALESRKVGTGFKIAIQFRLLQIYDLSGAVAADPTIDLDISKRDAPALERLLRSDGARLYSVHSSDALHGSPALLQAVAKTRPRLVTSQWLELIRQHPMRYIAMRAKVFRSVFLTPDIERCVPFVVGVKGSADTMKALGLAIRMDARDRGLLAYATIFLHTPIFSHLFFALLAAGLTVILLLRKRPEDIAIACLLLAALAFTLSFFVISIACDYRYLYFLDLSAIVGVFYFSLDPTLERTDRRDFVFLPAQNPSADRAADSGNDERCQRVPGRDE